MYIRDEVRDVSKREKHMGVSRPCAHLVGARGLSSADAIYKTLTASEYSELPLSKPSSAGLYPRFGPEWARRVGREPTVTQCLRAHRDEQRLNGDAYAYKWEMPDANVLSHAHSEIDDAHHAKLVRRTVIWLCGRGLARPHKDRPSSSDTSPLACAEMLAGGGVGVGGGTSNAQRP